MIRTGFISNSSSSSFLIRADGFDKKFFSVEDLKEKFPLTDDAKEKISEKDQESIYIGLWIILNTESDDTDVFSSFTEVTEDLPEKWKSAKMVEVGQDYYYENTNQPFPFHVSQLMFTYGDRLFATSNIKITGIC